MNAVIATIPYGTSDRESDSGDLKQPIPNQRAWAIETAIKLMAIKPPPVGTTEDDKRAIIFATAESFMNFAFPHIKA